MIKVNTTCRIVEAFCSVLHNTSTPDYKMFICVQVMASLGRPIVQWSILEINEDCLTFMFEAIKASHFEVISITEELKKSNLTETFVGTKTDGLMAMSNNQMLTVCSQFGSYVRISVDLPQENPVDVPVILPNYFSIMAASQASTRQQWLTFPRGSQGWSRSSV